MRDRFPPSHRNGNIVNDDGSAIKYRTMPKLALSRLLHGLQDGGVEFFAMEWDFPEVEHFDCAVPVDLFTVIRDPFSRAVSNYRFSKITGEIDREASFREAMNGSYTRPGPLHRSANYYTRKLCSTTAREELDEDYVLRAIEVLNWFRSVIIVGRDSLETELAKLGIEARARRANVTAELGNAEIPEALLLVTRADRAWFEAENSLDLQLFRRLSSSGESRPPPPSGAGRRKRRNWTPIG